MKPIRVVSVMTIALGCAIGNGVDAQKTSSSDALMGQALHQEEVEGNLSAAIASYNSVSSDPRTPAPLAAKALLRAGELYERLGNPSEARTRYERLVREFKEHAEIAKPATARLAALDAPAGIRETQVVARQIWVGDGVDVHARPTQDGRYLVFSDWVTSNTGNLAVRNLATGENRRLTSFTAGDGYVYEAAASPDGKQIAYIFYGEGRTSVRIIGFDGSHDRMLMEGTGGVYYPHWSPDGRRLAVSIINFAGDRTWHIALIDARDGSATRLKSTGWREPELGGFSPDGKFLLYAIHKASAATDSGIFALAVDESSRETVLVKGPANDMSPIGLHR